MREIFFRGKRIDNGEWVEGYFGIKGLDEFKQYCIMVPTFHGTDGLPVMQSDFYFTDIIVDPLTVGQYTGLTDKNGKKIFEGDIVKGVCYAGETEGIVTFKNGYYYIHAYAGYCEQLSRCSHMVEVIGNIHDNPELYGREA